MTIALTTSAQKKRTTTESKARTAQTTKKKAATTTKKGKTATYSNASIRGLQNQRAEIQKKIKQQEQALRANQTDVKQRLQNLMVINSEIDERQKSIDGIKTDITHIEGNIGILKSQLKTLEQQLFERQAKYVKSLRYMARHRTVQDKLMFIFSAKNFAQMYRRLRFMREYAAFQRVQGEIVKNKQAQVNNKHVQLETVKGHKNVLLYKNKQEHVALQGKQDEQQQVVQGLQRQQKTIQTIIAQQRQKDAALNAQIDRMVEQEVAKARARAIAEAARKEAAATAAKRRSAELAKKRAAAEAAARENARRIAEAKAREEQMKAAARAATEAQETAARENARRNAEAKAGAEAAARRAAAQAAANEATERQAKAEQAAREAEAERKAAERKAIADEARDKKDIADTKKNAEEVLKFSVADRMMSGGFESNRGRMPMPITGNYRVVSHFGQYNVEGLKGVTLDNKGINILGQTGCAARSIYDGEVSGVFGFGGTMVVMVRHGAYISVYCNLKSVSVHNGQKVGTRQLLGYVGADNILQFQLRHETAKLNPEQWLGR